MDEYVNSKSRVRYQRARIFIESHKKYTDAICISQEKDFKSTCDNLPI